MKEQYALGLDISTSHIGVCIIDKNDKIYEFFSIDYSKMGELDIFDKAKLFRIKMTDLFEKYNINKIYIEKPLLMFKEAASRIQVIVMLQQFSALCQFILLEMGKNNVLIPSSTAMKAALGVGRKPQYITDKKAWTALEFEKIHPEIELKRYKIGKNIGNIHPDEYDKIDAWMVCKASNLDK